MKNIIKLHWVDFLVVLLNIAAGRGNYLLYFVLGVSVGYKVEAFVIIIDIIYIALRFKPHKKNNNQRYPLLITLIYILLFYNVLNVMLHGGVSVTVFEILLVDLFFYAILTRLFSFLISKDYSPYKVIKYLSTGYICLSMISVLGVFVSFVLLQMGYNNEKEIAVDFMEANMEDGLYYVRSFFTVNYISTNIRLPFFQDYGYLCGLFHEPHVLTYNVFPGLILLLGLAEKKIYRYFAITSMVLVVLFTVSATNIMVSLICLAVFIYVKARRNFISALLTTLAIGIIIIWYVNFDDTVLNFVLERLDSDNSSQQTSKDLLLFAFTPKSFLGTDFFSTSFVKGSDKGQDIGFLVFILYVLFLVKYFHNIIRLLRIPQQDALTIGIASLYFILHSMKIGMTVFGQTLPILIIFLQLIVLDYYGRNKVVGRN